MKLKSKRKRKALTDEQAMDKWKRDIKRKMDDDPKLGLLDATYLTIPKGWHGVPL